MYVREGIVMASDSRLSLNTTQQQGDRQLIQVAVGFSDSNYKTFLAPNNIGISTFGVADIKGVPIAGYIESFISEHLSNGDIEVDNVSPKLLSYFRQFSPLPSTCFLVAGYKSQNGQKQQQVWLVDIQNDRFEQVNPPGQQGAQWGGEADILARLINPVAELDHSGKIKQVLPHFQIPWQFFTLQDAIDFCVFAVRSTIDAIRFQPRPKSVGGPIDVLVIKPDGAFWVQRKELHG
jgi:hypothetical protein